MNAAPEVGSFVRYTPLGTYNQRYPRTWIGRVDRVVDSSVLVRFVHAVPVRNTDSWYLISWLEPVSDDVAVAAALAD